MLNVLSVWPEVLWRTKQSPSRREYVRAIANITNHHLTGPGFPDWSNDASGLQNVQRIMPHADVILSYKAMGGCEKGRVNDPLEVASRYIVAEQFNECRTGMHPGSGHAHEECRKGGVRLVILHHAEDIPAMKPVEEYGAKIVVIPHCAAPVFAEEAKPWSERKGIVLTGTISDVYPLRERWRRLIRENRIPGGVYFHRPGNYTRSVEESDRLVRDYARALGSARVKLGCASKYGYALQHYSESALAGTVQVADVPLDAPDGFGDMLVPVSPSDDDTRLLKAVEAALERSEELGRKAQAVAATRYTTVRYAERFVAAASEM